MSNKIVSDPTYDGNENRKHIAGRGRYQQMTPMPADGGPIGATSPGEMGPGILGAPMTLDPHKAGRHSSDNLPNRAPERPRTQRTEETRRRIYSRNTDYKY